MGWASKRNGELLALAVGQFEVFLTADRNVSYQQDLLPTTFCVRRRQ
jgi:hypothetical protein